jgi:FKBP-type peptidyl-prolyl cis-trans isomerase FkpA
MSRLASFLCLASLVVVYGCGGDSNGPSATQPRGEFAQTDLIGGTGATATAGRLLTVNYTGWLYDPTQPESKGRQFDTSAGRGPYQFTLGAGSVIRGWDQGVVGMRVGGRRRLVIPPELGYGSAGSGSTIPSNASLVFDIELVNVQ